MRKGAPPFPCGWLRRCRTGDGDLLITGPSCACYCWVGEITKAVEHAERAIDLYDDYKHRYIADILNQDPKTIAGVCGSISIWTLGRPDRALQLNNEKDAHARRRGHLHRPRIRAEDWDSCIRSPLWPRGPAQAG
jgi:hypothetical protein